MKLSDYVALYLSRLGIRHVFAVTGGASVHLIQSIAETSGIDFICPQHEQAGSMAADAYSRVTGNIGAAISTSGPGATNMLTGVCCAYYDSVPVIYITGQVSTFRLKHDCGVRQLGFQETDTVDIFRPVTKYAVRVDDPNVIRYELEKATYIAKAGRQGPVLLDIPDNVGRSDINPDLLVPFTKPECDLQSRDTPDKINSCLKMIRSAKRPVIVFGWGVKLAKAENLARELVEKLNIPVALTWAAVDMFPSDHPLLIGSFGTHGTRYGNFAVQNSDFILAIGTRLDTRATGSPMSTFARGAKKVIVDIDPFELNKFSGKECAVDLLIESDAKIFLESFIGQIGDDTLRRDNRWMKQIEIWKEKYPICPSSYYNEDKLNPYVFVKSLSRESSEGDLVFVDTGCALAWMLQAFEFKSGQRIFHDFNNTAMGYALPASIGGCFANGRRPVTCVVGDGSLQMSLYELSTVIKHELPIRIFMINNQGYGMIRQTQDQWLDSKYYASNFAGGLSFPDFSKLADTYGFKTFSISQNDDARDKIRSVLECSGPVFCNVDIDPNHKVIPQVKYGHSLEDSEPFLSRHELLSNMNLDLDKIVNTGD